MSKKSTKSKSKSSSTDYDSMKVTELKDLCKKHKLPYGGLKTDLVKRLKAAATKGKFSSKKTTKKVVEESEPEEVSEEEEIVVKKSTKKSTKKSKKVVEESEPEEVSEEEEEVSEEKPKKKTSSKSSKKTKKVVVESEPEEESDEEEDQESESEEIVVKKSTKKATKKSKKVVEESEPEEVSEEEKPKKKVVAKGRKVRNAEPSEESSQEVSEEKPKKKVTKKVTIVEPEEDEESTIEDEDVENVEDIEEIPEEEEAPEEDEVDEHSNVETLFLNDLDSDVAMYYISGENLAEIFLNVYKDEDLRNGPIVNVFPRVISSMRERGLGKTHSIQHPGNAAPVIKGLVGAKVVKKIVPAPVKKEKVEVKSSAKTSKPKTPVKTPTKEKEDDSGNLQIEFDKNIGAYRLGEYVFDQKTKAVVGKVVDDAIVPLVKKDGAALFEDDMRFMIISEKELEEILKSNRNTKTTKDTEGDEGADDGVEIDDADADADPETQVNAELEEVVENVVIDQQKFEQFVKAQVASTNQTDYTAIATTAGLTEFEGQEIMVNYGKYTEKFPSVLVKYAVKKDANKTPFGGRRNK